ncbi:MAG: Gfo/Idh/MocA family oxidoreductase [Bacteroidota bacterium]
MKDKPNKGKISRLDFIKKTGLMIGGVGLLRGAALPALSSCDRSKEMIPLNLPDAKVKIGFIGTGQRLQEQIKYALDAIPNFEVIALCDIIPERAQKAKEFIAPNAQTYTDYKKLLANKDVEVVVVNTPLVSHFQIAKDSLEAGKHVNCEKTMVYSIEEAIELERIVKSRPNQIFRVAHEHRKNPSVNRVKEVVDSGVLGKITHIEGRWDSYNDWGRKLDQFASGKVDPKWEEMVNWRKYTKYCGGLMTEIITHLVDTTNYILGTHPIKAMSSGSINYWKDGRTTYDNVDTVYEYPEGFHGHFGANRASQYEGGFFKIYGELATIEFRMGVKHDVKITPNPKLKDKADIDGVTGASIKIIKDSEKKTLTVEDDVYESYNDNMYTYNADTIFSYKHLLDMVVEGAPVDISVTDGKKTAISVHMANLSNRNNTIEYWKPEYNG